MKKYDIVVCLNNNLFEQMLVLFQSAVMNCKRNVCFHILQSDFTEYQRKALYDYSEMIYPHEIKLYNVDPDDYNIFDSGERYPIQTYYYLLAHQLLPRDIERVLYMDCDAYIRSDIAQVYDMDFEGNYYIGSCEHPKRTLEEFLTKNKYDKDSLFNSGILMINLSLLRKDNINVDYFKEKIDEMGDGKYFADQGLLNYCFYNKIKIVTPYKCNYITWCSYMYKDVYDECETDNMPLMVHFTGLSTCKPWKSLLVFNDKCEKTIKYFRCDSKIEYLVRKYYFEWWDIARRLPEIIYMRLLNMAYYYVDTTKHELNWMTNAKNFFESLAYDEINNNRFEMWMESNNDKTFAILKCKDAAGRFLEEKLKSINANIVFKSQKRTLKELSVEEFKIVEKADIVVMCCVHTPIDYDEFNGVKSININTIFKL